MKFPLLLALLTGLFLLPAWAQNAVKPAPNLLPDADFEAPALASWSPWARAEGTLTARVDESEKHRGRSSLQVVHRGAQDWAVSQGRRLPVVAGDIFSLGTWSKTQEVGSAQIGVVTRDGAGQTLDWMTGAASTSGTHDWQWINRKFVVPPGCATIEFRFTGYGPGTTWFDDAELRRIGNLRDFRTQAHPIALQNKRLLLRIDNRGALTVTDKRNGKSWQSETVAPTIILKQTTPLPKAGARLALWDVANDLALTATVQLDAQANEFSVAVNGQGAQSESVAYPPAFLSGSGTALVVPLNEGILYPVDDPAVQPLSLEAYGGHGLCMRWWGVEDVRSGAGLMAIVQTPDDMRLQIDRREKGNLWARPLWEASHGAFGGVRRLTYALFDKGGYVAQAKRYRAHAQQIGLFKTLRQKQRENPNVDLLIGAANIWNWDMDKAALCREMKQMGWPKVLWSSGGNPQEIARINALGYLPGVYDIYSDVWAPGGPQWLNSEGWPENLAWTANGEWMRGWEHHEKNADGTITNYPGGVLCSSTWLARARRKIPTDLKEHPYRARFIDTVTAAPWRECYNPAHPLTRTQDRNYKMALLNYVSRDLKLVTGAETGIDASVPFVDYYEGMLSLGPYRLPDAGRDMLQYKAPTPEFLRFQVGHFYRVPLWELVYHDCTVSQWYWGDYNNKAPEVWPHRDLFNILYATPPMYMFDKATWEKQHARFDASYKSITPVVRRLGYDEMLSHEFLNGEHSVQRTRWKSGAQVIVNFGDQPFTLGDGTKIKPLSFLLRHRDSTKAL